VWSAPAAGQSQGKRRRLRSNDKSLDRVFLAEINHFCAERASHPQPRLFGAAYRAGGKPDDGVGRFFDLWLRSIIQADVAYVMKYYCFHHLLPLFLGISSRYFINERSKPDA